MLSVITAHAILALLLVLVLLGDASLVTLKWSDLSSQFFLKSNFSQSRLTPDVTVPLDGSPVELDLASSASSQKGSNFESNFNASCTLPMKGWKLKRLGLGKGKLTKYRIRIESAGDHSRFRVGLTPATGPLPGLPFYREWMADSDGCWVAAGVPDSLAEINGDNLWGSFGQDGWTATKAIDMQVDLDQGHVDFYNSEEQGSQIKLRFSLDGFAPLRSGRGGHKAEESHEYTSIKESLALNKVFFDFESASFGPDLPLGKSVIASLVPAEPLNACFPQKAVSGGKKKSFRGAIVYAQRGECDFLDKVLNAQNAGALAVVVGDNGLDAHAAGNKQEKDDELVIMNQYGRDKEADRVRIPSVFVSKKAHKHVMGFLNRGKTVSVALQGPVYAPPHHGMHWRENGLVPSLWLAPGSSVTISRVAEHDGEQTVRDGEERVSEPSQAAASDQGQGAQAHFCRPLSYVPLAASERKSMLTNVRNVKIAKNAALWSKRLVASGQVCNESGPLGASQSTSVQMRLLSYIIPWAENSIDQIKAAENELKLY